MKLTNVTVSQLALAAARLDVVEPAEHKLKWDVARMLNDLAWRANWSVRLKPDDVLQLKAVYVLDIFRACRAEKLESLERVIRAEVTEGDLAGQYMYEPEFGRLHARILGQDQSYRIYYCHPEGDEVWPDATAQPFEYMEISESLYELSSVTANIKEG